MSVLDLLLDEDSGLSSLFDTPTIRRSPTAGTPLEV
jgi:hypothetical protein